MAFRKKIYRTIEALQADLDTWIIEYNDQRPHQGRWCYGKTATHTLIGALPLAKEKLMAAMTIANTHHGCAADTDRQTKS